MKKAPLIALLALIADLACSQNLTNLDFESPLPVPEPGMFAMIGFGAILLGFQRWRKSKSLA